MLTRRLPNPFSSTSSDTATTTDVRAARVGPLFIAVYGLAYTGIWLALLTPIVVTISLRVRELTPAHAAQNLALVLSVGAASRLDDVVVGAERRRGDRVEPQRRIRSGLDRVHDRRSHQHEIAACHWMAPLS